MKAADLRRTMDEVARATWHDYELANLDDVSRPVTFEQVGITDLTTMMAIYRECQPDYVVNFAVESHNDRAILDPTAFIRSDALGAQVMAECFRQVPVRSHVPAVWQEGPRVWRRGAALGLAARQRPLHRRAPGVARRARPDPGLEATRPELLPLIDISAPLRSYQP